MLSSVFGVTNIKYNQEKTQNNIDIILIDTWQRSDLKATTAWWQQCETSVATRRQHEVRILLRIKWHHIVILIFLFEMTNIISFNYVSVATWAYHCYRNCHSYQRKMCLYDIESERHMYPLLLKSYLLFLCHVSISTENPKWKCVYIRKATNSRQTKGVEKKDNGEWIHKTKQQAEYE